MLPALLITRGPSKAKRKKRTPPTSLAIRLIPLNSWNGERREGGKGGGRKIKEKASSLQLASRP